MFTKTCEVLKTSQVFDRCWMSANADIQIILLLQLHQTLRTHTPLVILTDILHLVQIQLHGAALAFGEGICLTLHTCTAAFATDNLVF